MYIQWNTFGCASGVHEFTRSIIREDKEFRSACCGPNFQQRKTACACFNPEYWSLRDKQGKHPAAASNPISNQKCGRRPSSSNEYPRLNFPHTNLKARNILT